MVKLNRDINNEHVHGKEIQEKMVQPIDPHKLKFEVGIIGLGNIGSAVAHYLLSDFPNSKLNIYSRSYNSQEKDLREQRIRELAGDLPGTQERIRMFRTIDGELSCNGNGKKRLLESDIIIYCARNQTVSFSEFKERDDEFFANLEKIKEDAERLNGYKKGIVLVATNPLELTATAIEKISGIPNNKIIASSYIDTYRFRGVIAEQLFKQVNILVSQDSLRGAVVIGPHAPDMVPIYSSIRVGRKKFLEDPRLDKDNLRGKIKEEVKKALIEGPTKFQTSDSPMRNVRVPSKALIETVKAILTEQEIPTTSYSKDQELTKVPDCYITNICSSTRLEDKLNGSTLSAEVNPDFLNKISKSERGKYIESKTNLVHKINSALKKAGLN